MFYLLALGGPIESDSQLAPSVKNPSISIGVKRRIVSNPDTEIAVATVKPAPKRQRPETSSSTIIISSDDEEVIFVKSNHSKKPSTNSKKNKIEKQRDVISLCPLSEPNKPCIRCKVVKMSKGKLLSCHCGAAPVTLRRGQVEGAQAHWRSGMYKIL